MPSSKLFESPDFPPALLSALEQFEDHLAKVVSRKPQLRLRLVCRRTVAKVDSMGALGILGLIARQGQVKGHVGRLARLGHPDIVQLGLDLRLHGFGQLVQHVGGLVDPAALLRGLG